MNGTLYLVATPLGNLKDVSRRAIEVIQKADLILCEDTRITRKLLSHYQIRGGLTSFHKFNEAKKLNSILQKLQAGKNIALLPDAGTPGICDPGTALVRQAHQHGIRIEAVPGPSALTIAFSLSGFPHPYHFWGFFPKKVHRNFFTRLSLCPGSHFFFLSPHLLSKSLQQLAAHAPATHLFLGKEISKRHESYFWGSPAKMQSAILSHKEKQRGEWILGLESLPPIAAKETILYLKKSSLSKKEIAALLHTLTSLSHSEIYELF